VGRKSEPPNFRPLKFVSVYIYIYIDGFVEWQPSFQDYGAMLQLVGPMGRLPSAHWRSLPLGEESELRAWLLARRYLMLASTSLLCYCSCFKAGCVVLYSAHLELSLIFKSRVRKYFDLGTMWVNGGWYAPRMMQRPKNILNFWMDCGNWSTMQNIPWICRICILYEEIHSALQQSTPLNPSRQATWRPSGKCGGDDCWKAAKVGQLGQC